MADQSVYFASVVDKWVSENKARATAVFRQSAQDVIEEMQKVGPSVASTRAAIAAGGGKFGPVEAAGDGGHLPVDTGFLRASLVATKGAPSAMLVGAERVRKNYDDGAVLLVINSLELGDVLYASYTAEYARRINYGFSGTDKAGRTYAQRGYHFVDLAAQKWPQIVQANSAKLRTMAQESGSNG